MSSRHLALALVLIAAPLAGCLAAEGGPSGALPFETIDRGPNSDVEQREEIVVRSTDEWRQLWDRHSDDERPEVDFSEQMVLAIFKGQSPDGCHGAEIVNVTGHEDRIDVEGVYYEVTDAHCTQQITYPFHVVALDRHDVNVTFDTRDETRQIHDGEEPDGSEEPDDESPGEQGSYTCREPGEASESPTSAEELGFETLADGQQSNIQEPCVTVAENRSSWKALWQDHHGASYADEERPQVDFDQSVVAAIFKGESSDACHGAEVTNVTRDGDDLVVHAVFYVIEGASCAEVITYPYHIVEIERPEGEVTFDVREETRQR